MLESLYNYSNELMELALAEEPIPEPLIHKVLREATVHLQIQPVLCGSALHGIGVQPMLDAVAAYLPNPPDVPPVEGIDLAKHKGKGKGGRSRRRAGEKNSPQARSGRAVLRPGVQGAAVQDGRPGLGAHLLRHARAQLAACSTRRATRRKTSPSSGGFTPSKKDEQLEAARAGDIVGVIGLRDSITGDTLCDTREPILLESIEFPETVISMAIEPESTDDRKKLATRSTCSASRIPTFRAERKSRRPARRSSAAWASCTWK